MCGRWYFVESWGNKNSDDQVYITDDGSNVYVNNVAGGNGICSLTLETVDSDYYFPCHGDLNGTSFNYTCSNCYNSPGTIYNKYPHLNTQHYHYVAGNLISNQQFGEGTYMELKFRLPPYSHQNVKGIQENFWLFRMNGNIYCNPSPNACYEEIDVFEVDNKNAYRFSPTMRVGGILGVDSSHCNSGSTQDVFWKGISKPFDYNVSNFSDSAYRIVGLEWHREKMNIYLDGELIRSMGIQEQLDFFGVPYLCPMNVYLTLSSTGFYESSPSDKDTIDFSNQVPYKMEIDYFKVYQLNPVASVYSSLCGAGTFNSATWAHFNNEVQDSITFGTTSSCTWVVPPTSAPQPRYVFRAKDYIELGPGFETNTNSAEVYLDVSKK